MSPVFSELVSQPRVASFLRSAIESDRVSHAYLFTGPPGAGKRTTAKAFAAALMCEKRGCGGCSACLRVRRGVHPDVHTLAPEGAAGYLAEQVRDIVRDVSLAPIEGPYKFYIVESADLFNDSSANAFLKTLEEPPDDVVFVLMSHSWEAVLPTIASRCQIVRFRRLAPSESMALLREKTGAGRDEAAAALAATAGVVPRATEFLRSPARRAARDTILHTMKDLATMDDLDVLTAAREVLTVVKAPLEEVRAVHASELAEREEFLGSKVSTKAVEERHKRQLTAREREGVGEALNVVESWLRDCLVLSQGLGELTANADAGDAMEEVAAVITPGAAIAALGAVNDARRSVSYNVSPQLAVEAMLFDIREVLRCPR
jgi:DNA polymerase-3 subunit delta'